MTPTPRKAFIQASLRDWRETAQTGVHFSHGETDAAESGPETRHIIYIQVNNPFVFAFSRESDLQPKSGVFVCEGWLNNGTSGRPTFCTQPPRPSRLEAEATSPSAETTAMAVKGRPRGRCPGVTTDTAPCSLENCDVAWVARKLTWRGSLENCDVAWVARKL